MKLISDLITYCQNENIILLLGDELYQNAIADQVEYDYNQLIMLAGFNVIPTFENGRVVSEKYNGVIALGRKFDEVTEMQDEQEVIISQTTSSLDETYEQKYVRRLKDLYELLIAHLGSFTCENEIIIESAEMKTQINSFDINADFVACTISLVYE